MAISEVSNLYFINRPTENLSTSNTPHMWRLLAFLNTLQVSEICSDPALGPRRASINICAADESEQQQVSEMRTSLNKPNHGGSFMC